MFVIVFHSFDTRKRNERQTRSKRSEQQEERAGVCMSIVIAQKGVAQDCVRRAKCVLDKLQG